jgi:hypothetical protein
MFSIQLIDEGVSNLYGNVSSFALLKMLDVEQLQQE